MGAGADQREVAWVERLPKRNAFRHAVAGGGGLGDRQVRGSGLERPSSMPASPTTVSPR